MVLRLTDVSPHGLVIRESKFRKSKLVTLHPATTEALDAYLAIRRAQATPDDHLFVLDRGRVPGPHAVPRVFRKLAIQTGIRTGTAHRQATAPSRPRSEASTPGGATR